MAAIFPVNLSDKSSLPRSNGRVKRPYEIACFSYDKDHQFRLDDSAMKWYYPPQDFLDVDLSRGFDKFDKLDDESVDEHLDSLLKTIMEHEKKKGEKIDAQLVTWRGMMTKILAAGYDDEGFEMNATLYRDCIFIEEHHAYKVKRNTEQQQRQREKQKQREKSNRGNRRGGGNYGPQHPPEVMQFWGYKFESLATLPRPWAEVSRDYIESRDSLTVSNKEQYCSVIRTAIDDTILCLGGEVDAIWDSKPTTAKTPINWVELKTTAQVMSDIDDLRFKRKMMKWWIQSYLLGVPKIAIGFRDRNGFLKQVQEIETANIPIMVNRDERVEWSADGCVEFGARFIKWLRQTINDDGVWRIRRQPKAMEIEVYRIEEAGHGDIVTDEFMNWRIQLEISGGPRSEPGPELEPMEGVELGEGGDQT